MILLDLKSTLLGAVQVVNSETHFPQNFGSKKTNTPQL